MAHNPDTEDVPANCLPGIAKRQKNIRGQGSSIVAAAAPSSTWPSAHFLQCKIPEVRCIEILGYFVVWFIHPLYELPATELSIHSDLLTSSFL